MPSAAAVAMRSPRPSHRPRFRFSCCDVPGDSPAASRSSVIVDLVSAWREGVPLGAELVEPLPLGGAGLGVAGVEVERVAVVGDLGGAVVAMQGAQLPGYRAAAGLWDAGGGQRGPHAGTGVVTGGLGGRVGFEQVQGAAAAVDPPLRVATPSPMPVARTRPAVPPRMSFRFMIHLREGCGWSATPPDWSLWLPDWSAPCGLRVGGRRGCRDRR